jgi:hypothetical protein
MSIYYPISSRAQYSKSLLFHQSSAASSAVNYAIPRATLHPLFWRGLERQSFRESSDRPCLRQNHCDIILSDTLSNAAKSRSSTFPPLNNQPISSPKRSPPLKHQQSVEILGSDYEWKIAGIYNGCVDHETLKKSKCTRNVVDISIISNVVLESYGRIEKYKTFSPTIVCPTTTNSDSTEARMIKQK